MLTRSNLKIFFNLILYLSTLILPLNFRALSSNKLISNQTQDNKIESDIKIEYILGEGDILFINFLGLELFNNYYTINPEGNLILPELNQFYASGLTLKDLNQKLTNEYKKYIIDPNIEILISFYRPINFYIKGEVIDPGMHQLSNNKLKEAPKYLPINASGTNPLPTSDSLITVKLFDAIKKAGGVTNNADLSKVSIIRNNSDSQGGGKIKTDIDLLHLITSGDQKNNIRIFDGDIINIPKSNKSIKEQLLTINNSNISPSKISVFITGNIDDPGSYEFRKGVNMIQVITSAGGKKLLSKNIEFIRFNNSGMTQKRVIKYDINAQVGTMNNPILMDGDIINIRTSLLEKTAEVLTEISNPILTGFGLYSIFN